MATSLPSKFVSVRHLLSELTVARLSRLYAECQPRVLVVTDGLNFNPASGFGLTQFVATLRGSTIHGMAPQVSTACRFGSGGGADFTDYDFDDASNGLLVGRWDVLFLFGSYEQAVSDLPADQRRTIETFMHRGGGVFATGDHETLGASLCGDIGRVREMRRWKNAQTPPDIRNTNRLSTNLSGDDETEEFTDQSDRHPQRLYLNFRTAAGGTGQAHPLMQLVAPHKVLEIFPDHPHEGECLVPAAFGGTMDNAGASVPQWPVDALGALVRPEMVASSVSHGDGFPGGPTGAKQALEPRLFGAIAAYDGHRAAVGNGAGVGRVVTDATWHHFININIDGKESPYSGLQTAAGADTDELLRIRRHWVNLATWLMPKNVRRCRRYPFVLEELVRYPLFEELDLPRPPEPFKPDLGAAAALGATLARSMALRVPAWEPQAMADDALEDALGIDALARLRASPRQAGVALDELRLVALGGLVHGIVQELAELPSPDAIEPHKTFEGAVRRGVSLALNHRLMEQRRCAGELDRLIGALEQQQR